VARKSLVARITERLKRYGTKRYLAICQGVPKFDHRRVDAPLGWNERLGRRGVVAGGKSALSDITVLDRAAGAALVSVVLHTGRTHQIRIHMPHLGHPLMGEYRYPAETTAAPESVELSVESPRTALHAVEITLGGEAPLRLVAPFPDDLRGLAARLGLDVPCLELRS
ncbi:MAG: RNA pseudouridine synthase, partial [Myxococcota bacterium]